MAGRKALVLAGAGPQCVTRTDEQVPDALRLREFHEVPGAARDGVGEQEGLLTVTGRMGDDVQVEVADAAPKRRSTPSSRIPTRFQMPSPAGSSWISRGTVSSTVSVDIVRDRSAARFSLAGVPQAAPGLMVLGPVALGVGVVVTAFGAQEEPWVPSGPRRRCGWSPPPGAVPPGSVE